MGAYGPQLSTYIINFPRSIAAMLQHFLGLWLVSPILASLLPEILLPQFHFKFCFLSIMLFFLFYHPMTNKSFLSNFLNKFKIFIILKVLYIFNLGFLHFWYIFSKTGTSTTIIAFSRKHTLLSICIYFAPIVSF